MGDADVRLDGTTEQRADNGFRLGLALSGAISAGAYTAGVIDFLVEALEAWEAERGKATTPQHRAGLKVITGASAGSITGAVGLLALARGPEAQKLSPAEVAASLRTPGQTYNPNRCVLQPLYTAWVEQPRLMADRDGELDFLSVQDLDAKAGVASLLNSTLLDAIKTQALRGTGKAPSRRPYLARDMHLYMTLSNLRGIPFQIDFGEGTYGMLTHGDRLHYRISGLGEWEGEGSRWLREDSYTPLDTATLPVHPEDRTPADWELYGTVALASSAFPVGLASREITSPYAGYRGRAYPIDADQEKLIKPCFPGIAEDAMGDYKFLNVDGGLINNSPYDYAEYALLGIPRRRDPPAADAQQQGRRTTAALLMVSPFPEPPAFLPEGQPKPELAAVLRTLVPTLMTQARFRTSDLVKALDPKDYSRFLIAPHREDKPNHEAEYRIACGALGGFGGFLDRSFRAHDYQLGRRNCQQFLRKHLGLPVGADGIEDRAELRIAATGTREARTPIIPLLGDAQFEVALPPWPRMRGDLRRLERRIALRLKKLMPILIETQTRSLRLRWIAKAGLRLGKTRLLETVKWAIVSDLVLRDQITGWELPAELDGNAATARAVLAGMANPAFDFRTAAGLARSLHKPEAEIEAIVRALEHARSKARVVAAPWDGRLFTLAERAPKGPESWPGIGRLVRALTPPRSDED